MREFTPRQIAAIDQVHQEAVIQLDGMIAAARTDMRRHIAEDEGMAEAAGIASLAADFTRGILEKQPRIALVLAAAVYRLAIACPDCNTYPCCCS